MTEPQPRTARLVFDASAIAGFVAGAVAPGELLAEIDAEKGAVIVPLPCLASAAAHLVDEQPWLDILLGHPATTLVSDDPAHWRQLAALHAMLGQYELAAPAWIALDYDVQILTRHPEHYVALDETRRALPFDD